MLITLNGKPFEVEENQTVEGLVANLELDPKKIAIEMNLEIVGLHEFSSRKIPANAKIEIVHFIGGG
jgi:thiamine biosynthesis protein ThiS